MKKFIQKINSNKILFTIFIIIVFSLFMLITSGAGAWNGVVSHFLMSFEKIYSETYYGFQFIGEMIWFLCLIPVILIFKNKYIFTQKREKLLKSLMFGWPLIIYTIMALTYSIISKNITSINGYEVIALLCLTLTVGLFEEILCRGWLQNEFIERFGTNRKGVIYSIIASGTIFGLMHFGNLMSGQDIFTTIIQVLGATITGITFGLIYYRTKNIWSVILLHGLWDFAIFFANINVATSCIDIKTSLDTVTPLLGVLAIFVALFASIPELSVTLMLLNKNDINEGLEKEYQEKIFKDDIKRIKTNKIVFSIIIGLYLIIYSIVMIVTGNTSTSCPGYINESTNDYTETLYNYKEYNLATTKQLTTTKCNYINNQNICNDYLETISYQYNFKINENHKLVLTNITNNQQILFDYDGVFSFAIFENNNQYSIIILSMNKSGQVITYYSDYITEDNISNDNQFIDSLKNSFKQLMLPSVIKYIGYYQTSNNTYKYPLFVSSVNDKYILYPDDTIHKYKRELKMSPLD